MAMPEIRQSENSQILKLRSSLFQKRIVRTDLYLYAFINTIQGVPNLLDHRLRLQIKQGVLIPSVNIQRHLILIITTLTKL